MYLVINCVKAESLVFYDFSDLSNIQLNGKSADLNPNDSNVLSLTNDVGQWSSAFFMETISLDNLASFSVAFEFQITDPQGISDPDGQGADGLAFVVQANTNSAGGPGGGIGYKGIDNSIAIEFDTWRNRNWDNDDGNHIGINIDGDLNSIAQAPMTPRMNNDAVWTVWIDYDGVDETIEVRASESSERPTDATLATTIDLIDILGTSDAYIGFTSGTGGAAGDHDIISMMFHDDYNPIASMSIPEPKTHVLMILPLLFMLITKFMKSSQ